MQKKKKATLLPKLYWQNLNLFVVDFHKRGEFNHLTRRTPDYNAMSFELHINKKNLHWTE